MYSDAINHLLLHNNIGIMLIRSQEMVNKEKGIELKKDIPFS